MIFFAVILLHLSIDNSKGLSSREAARGHATNVDSEMLSVTINRIYNPSG